MSNFYFCLKVLTIFNNYAVIYFYLQSCSTFYPDAVKDFCMFGRVKHSIIQRSISIFLFIVKSILEARLSENDEGKHISILELPGDILIIPQATLGGNLKGKSMQYHRNINKDTGLMLYSKFVQFCEESVTKCDRCREKQTCVKYGTYGNRQVFSTVTNGPYTHLLEF